LHLLERFGVVAAVVGDRLGVFAAARRSSLTTLSGIALSVGSVASGLLI
jgi:hypothetical protein